MIIKKVCKSCGKKSYFLKLNDDLLCSECAKLKEHELTTSEIVRELGDYVKGQGDASNVKKYMSLYEEKEKRTHENFNEVYSNFEKARTLEKKGDLDKALLMYTNNLSNCPSGTDYYTRPCIILEKRQEYERAIEICDLVIKFINEGRISADVEEFEHRKARLVRKLSKNKQ